MAVIRLVIFLIVCSSCVSQTTDNSSSQLSDGTFEDEAKCKEKCIGEHDATCQKTTKNTFVCKCASTFYSIQQDCQAECESNQYWSLFTYGSCSEYTSSVLSGSCNLQCVFRVRVWTTVFIIILFVAACLIILVMLPMCIVNCVSCVRVRKHQKAIEDLHVVNEMGGGTSKTASAQQLAAMSPWHQYPYYNYYHGAR